MTEDVSAGRLYAEVVSDTTGFARDAKRKIDAEVKALRAKIKVELDQRGLVTQARAAAKVASAAAVVRLKVELDTRGLIGQAKAAAAAASQAATVKVRAEIDTSAVARDTKAAAETASRTNVNVNVDADTAKAEAEVEALKQRSGKTPIKVPVSVDSKGLKSAGTALTQLSKAPAIAGGVFMLGTAVVQLGGGLFAMASAASQSVGVLAAIPSLAGIAAQAVASLLVGFSGIGTALGAMSKAEQATTASTVAGGAQARATARAVQAASKARERAARSVADAQRGLQDAQKAADDQAVRGARDVASARRTLADARANAVDNERTSLETVSDAEWALARAQEASQTAQENLTQARQDARERIDDLNLALRQGTLDEKGAMLALEKARQKLADVNWDPRSSSTDKQSADLGLQQAELDLQRVRDANEDLKKEAAKANKDGVDGADNVKAAHNDVRDTLHAEQEAAENLAKAQKDAAQSQVDSARAIADAQQGLADSLKAQQDGAIAAARAVEDAQRGIADAKDNLAEADRNLADASDSAAAGGTKAAAALAAQEAALAKLSPAGRSFAKFLFGLKGRWDELRQATQTALLPPIQSGIKAALPIIDTLQTGLVKTATIVGGLGKDLGEALGSKTVNKDVASIMDSNNRSLGFFGKTAGSLLTILKDLAVVAGPVLVEPFAKWTATLTKGWQESIKTARETGKLKTFLKQAGDTAAQLGRIVGNVVGALFDMGKAAAPSGQELLDTFEKITQKWQDWTGSTEGQTRMKEFFDATKPVTEELGRLVENLIEFITKAGEGGGGALNGFLQTLNAILTGLNKLMEIPGVAPFLGWVMTLAGVGGALGLVSGVFLKMAGNLGKLTKITGLNALVKQIRGVGEEGKKTGDVIEGPFGRAFKKGAGTLRDSAAALRLWVVENGKAAASAVVTAAKFVAQRVATLAMAVASGVARVATIAWTAVQWLLNAAFLANPVVLIVAAIVVAIALLVGAFIYAWKHSEKFRTIVTAALNGLKAAALAVFNALSTAVKFVIDFVQNHWKLLLAIIGGPFVAIAILIATHWDKIKSIFGGAIGYIVNLLGTIWHNLSALISLPVYVAIALIKAAWSAISTAFTAAKDWVIGTFKAAWAAVSGVLSGPIEAAKNFIATRIENIKTNFTAVKDWVISTFKSAWAAVSGVLSGPIDAAKKFIATRIDNIKNNFTAVKDWIVTTFAAAWAKVKEKLTGPINDAKAALDKVLGAGKGGIRQVFDDAVSAISKIWDGLKLAAKTPIKFIVETILNDGLIGGFNWLAGKVGAPTMDPIPLPNGFEAGGHFTGRIPGAPSKKDNLLAHGPRGEGIGLATGEYIVNAEDTQKNLPLLQAINAGKLRIGDAMRGFANGGLFGNMKGAITGALSKGKDLGADVLGVLKDPGKWVKEKMAGPLGRIRELGPSSLVDIVKGIPTKIVGVVADKAKSFLTGLGGSGGGAPGEATVYPGAPGSVINFRGEPLNTRTVNMILAAEKLLHGKKFAITQGSYQNATSYSGTTHTGGGVFDSVMHPVMAAAVNALRKVGFAAWDRTGKGNWAPHIHAVAIGDPTASASAKAQVQDFLHGGDGLANGGLVGGQTVGNAPAFDAEALMQALGVTFDTGGFVRPGTTVVNNKTGEHEAMFQPEAWKGANAVLMQIRALAGQVRTTQGARGGSAPLVGSLSLTVGDKTDIPDALDEVEHRFRVIKRGGVYAERTAGASA